MAKNPRQDPLEQTVQLLNRMAALLGRDSEPIDWGRLSLEIEAARLLWKSNAEPAAQTNASLSGNTSFPNPAQCGAAAESADSALASAKDKNRSLTLSHIRAMVGHLTSPSRSNEIMTGTTQVDGLTVKTMKREFNSANILRITVGTNCPQGGDAGHGGRTLIILEDTGSTDMRCTERPGAVQLVFGGDTECATLISALQFAAETLRDMQDENTRST